MVLTICKLTLAQTFFLTTPTKELRKLLSKLPAKENTTTSFTAMLFHFRILQATRQSNLKPWSHSSMA